jgi:hypothetical protein
LKAELFNRTGYEFEIAWEKDRDAVNKLLLESGREPKDIDLGLAWFLHVPSKTLSASGRWLELADILAPAEKK